MEKIYDPTTTCKASGVVNKIIGGKSTINNCGYYYRLRLNDGTRDYIIRGLDKNNVGYGTGCENTFYAFTGGQLPKVGDEMYVIAQYKDSWIIELGKDIFNKFNYLPECPITADGSPSYDEFIWADKCKVSGAIENIKRNFTDTCGFNLGIKVKNGENTYIVLSREYFSGKGISLCLGTGDGWFPINSTDGKITTHINLGDNFYAILNQQDNTILRYGQDEYNNADNSIPICSSATIKQIQTFTGGLSENQITQVMDTVEKQIIKEFPALDNRISTITTGTSSIASGNISNTKENSETKKTLTVKAPKVITQASKSKQDATKNIISTYINSGAEILETNSGKTLIESNYTNTGLMQNTNEQTKSDDLKQNNYDTIIGSILVLLFIGITLISLHKRKITKNIL